MTEGVDYAWPPHPSAGALKNAGKGFVCRYLSRDASKDLTLSEANALAAVGIWSVVVWETTASRAASSFANGQADAMYARDLAKALQQPLDRPIYFAVDFDANGAECHDYFQGVVSTLGIDRVGVYGGIKPLRYLDSVGLATWFWQTYAWSGGQWFSKNHIEQYKNEVSVGGISGVDLDRSKQADYGQWMPGKGPDTVATPSAKDNAIAVWNTDGIISSPPATQTGDKPNMYWAAKSYLQQIYAQNEQILANQQVLLAAVAQLSAKIDGAATNQAKVDADAVVDALAARLAGGSS